MSGQFRYQIIEDPTETAYFYPLVTSGEIDVENKIKLKGYTVYMKDERTEEGGGKRMKLTGAVFPQGFANFLARSLSMT